ncbi:MAG: TylF/MycF/NovP-related O-methyltransferase [Actinomycetes bacterium]
MPDAASLYLDLLQRALTRTGFEDEVVEPLAVASPLDRVARRLAHRRGAEVVRRHRPDPRRREVGGDLPAGAETMVGLTRLTHLRHCVETVLRDGVPGDLVETGVWRGGASILMRGVLAAHGVTDRTVWVADSFAGLPRPDADRYPADAGDDHWTRPELAVGLDEVQRNFAKYGLLDDQVRFLRGWFSDTLPDAPIATIAVLRLDGDLYESTTDALTALYPKVAPGGFVVIDDYGAIEACRQATDDFRASRGITEELVQIDWTGYVWRRAS